MKLFPHLRIALICAITSLGIATQIKAADGTWTALSGGSASGAWTLPGNWSGSVVASGAGFTADFSTLDITATSTVTLDAAVTIGNLTFGDTATGSAANWIVGNGGTPANTLTLSAATPTITVNALGTGSSVTVGAVIEGTSGLVKSGAGKLILNSANTYSGTLTNVNFGARQFGTIVNRGRLVLGNATAAGTGDILAVQGAGTAILDLNGQTVSNNIALYADTYLENSNTGTAAVINGGVTISNYGRIGSVSGDGTGTVIVNGNLAFANSGHTAYFNLAGGLTILNGTNGAGIYTVQGGTLRANDGTGLNSSGRLNIAGGVFETGVNFTRTLGAGAGLVDVGGASTAATNGFSAYGGAVTVALGGLSTPTAITWGTGNFLTSTSTLVLNAATADNTITFANAVNLNGATRTITVNASTAIVSGNLTNSTGTAGLTKTGAGILSLTGTNSYNGDTTISAGTLRGNVASLPGAIVNNAALIFDQATDATFSPIISGTGTFEKTGAGVLTLSGVNTFSGNALVSQGSVKLGDNAALGTTGGYTTVASGAALDLNGKNVGGELVKISGTGISGAGALVNTSGSSATGLRLELLAAASIGGTGRMDTTFNGTVINAGTNTITKTGTGQFTINVGTTSMGTFNIDQGSVVVVNSATPLGNTSFGTNVANGASLQFFNSTGATITNSENITLANGAELAGTTATSINALGGGITLSSGTASIRVENSGIGTLRLDGIITGAGGINKVSLGTLLLTGVNTYTGNTTVTGGAVNVADNAELRFKIQGNGVNNGIAGSGSITIDGDFRFDLTTAGTTVGNSWNIINVTGLTETFGATFQARSTLGNFSNNSGLWTIAENGVSYEFSQTTGLLTVVPEPSTWLLLALGLTFVVTLRRRSA